MNHEVPIELYVASKQVGPRCGGFSRTDTVNEQTEISMIILSFMECTLRYRDFVSPWPKTSYNDKGSRNFRREL